MSHGIELPIDRLFSTKDTEWHGLANVVEQIDGEVVAPLLFPIVSGNIVVQIGDALVQMSRHKALVADYRECRPDLIEDEATSGGFVPLHIPKNTYVEIENRAVWEAMEKALKDVDGKVTCVGTLEGGKKFFVSAQLGGEGESSFKVNNDEFKANLNFITSHDGTLGVEAYDSTVRIVCMNTLRWSRDAAGDVGFKVYHSKNANFAMANLGELVNRVITGRADFKNSMEYLGKMKMAPSEAANFLRGYFGSLPTFDKDEGLSTRVKNSIDEIMNLYAKGKGNVGKTAYDVLNGITEYYTQGDGTGKQSKPLEKMYKANFGKAADHKDAICNALLSEERVKELVKIGKKLND